jgi:AAA15 family ATPase/GTPase
MIIEFRAQNYLSFGSMFEFSMTATTDNTKADDATYKVGDELYLKVAAIYGANGSGKSNFISAYRYMRSIVLGRKEFDGAKFKLDEQKSSEPSFFEVVFIGKDKNRYRYGFELSDSEIISEWLFCSKTRKETTYFTREKQNITVGRLFKEGKGLESKTKNSRLFLKVVASLNGSIAQLVVDWFKGTRVLNGIAMGNMQTLEEIVERGDSYRKRIVDVLHAFDIQMEDFKLRELFASVVDIDQMEGAPDSLKKIVAIMNEYIKSEDYKPVPNVMTIRKKYSHKKPSGEIELNMLEESHGTQKLFAIAGFIVDALDDGSTLFIDELESQLHPMVTKQIVQIFNSKETNKKNAQLIFSTHDTNLLSELRRDQVWFTEKDRYGDSHMYSLVEYKNPRKEAVLEKDYIKGKYGAVPFIGDFTSICK